MIKSVNKIIIQLIMAICVTFIIFGGKVHAEKLDINTTDSWYFPAKGEISDIFDSREGKHKGIDISGKYKSPVYAAEDGIVEKSYYSQTYGNVVFLHHPNGFETVYAHLAKRLVHDGDEVTKGETVGLMGNTGESTGTHLHFEIHEGEWTIDKKNAINPFIVYGNGEIGQLVFALQHDPYGITDVMNPIILEPQIEVLKPFYKAEELTMVVTESDTLRSINTLINWNDNDTKNTYIVKKGDTLINISEKFNVPMESLLALNHIHNKDLIYPDQKITLRADDRNVLSNRLIFR